ncbi:uspa [hydrocarbon metagenome]|uniref:Uspa n=1 Tax=hydrocarbon metagenome TaxID=938273 RepID=A0A0W8E4B9_9ZZZZ
MGEQILNATLKGIDVSQVIVSKKTVTGYPASEIIDEIKRGFDLVVMGSRGHRPLVGAVLGSVTQRVLADAPCPVLVVK